jgi:hypothetical protein
MRLTNAPTNALTAVTTAYASAYASAPTNDANARRTRPPIPPRAFVASRAAAGTALASRTQARFRWRGPRARMLPNHRSNPQATFGIPSTIESNHSTSLADLVTSSGKGRYSPRCRHMHVDNQQPAARTRARPMLGEAARVRDSFAAMPLHSTAANAPTHQRAPQRALCSHGYPRCFPALDRTNALSANSVRCQRLALSRSANSLCWGHIGRAMRARTAEAPLALIVGRTRPSEPATSPITGHDQIEIGREGGWGRKGRSLPTFICSSNFAPIFPRVLSVPPQRSCTSAEHCIP